jgi:hypothetical protein
LNPTFVRFPNCFCVLYSGTLCRQPYIPRRFHAGQSVQTISSGRSRHQPLRDEVLDCGLNCELYLSRIFRPVFSCHINSLPCVDLDHSVILIVIRRLIQATEHIGSLAKPPAGGSHLRGVSAMLVVAVFAPSRSAASVCTTVHPTPSPPCDRRRLAWRARPGPGSAATGL